jgi:hypothetical protein
MVYECNHSAFVHTCSVMKPGEAAFCLRVEVTVEDADAHADLVVGLVGILLGILVSRLRRHRLVVFAPAHGVIVASSVHNGLVERSVAFPCKMQTENIRF